MKIIIIDQTNTPEGSPKSFRAGVFKGENKEVFAKTEMEALKKLVEKLEAKNDKWV